MARTLLMYGETNTYKTSNVAEFAKWLYARYQKPVGLITSDSGWAPAQNEVDAGLILPLKLSSCKYPVAVIKLLSKGYWPADLDVKTGMFSEEKLIAPVVNKPSILSGYAIEGLHTNAKIFMGDSEDKGRAIGEPLQGTEYDRDTSSFKTKYVELGVKHVMRSRGTYYHAQVITERYVDAFKSLPVPWVMMSSHQTLGKDDNDRPAFGPAICGTANVDKITGWFECSLHSISQMYDYATPVLDADGHFQYVNDVLKTRSVKRESAVLWFVKHADATLPSQLWHAKLGVPVARQMEILKRWPDGHLWLVVDENTGEYTSSLATLLEMIDPTPEGKG